MSMLPSFHSAFGPDSALIVHPVLTSADTGSVSLGDVNSHSAPWKSTEPTGPAAPCSSGSSSASVRRTGVKDEESLRPASTGSSSGSAGAHLRRGEDSTSSFADVPSGSTGSGSTRLPVALDPLPLDKFGLSLDGSAYICSGSSKRIRTRSVNGAAYRTLVAGSDSLLRNGSASGMASSAGSQRRALALRLGFLEDTSANPRDSDAALFAVNVNPIDTQHSFQSSVMGRPAPVPGAAAIFPGPTKSDFSALFSTLDPTATVFDSVGNHDEQSRPNPTDATPTSGSPGARPMPGSVDFLPPTTTPPPVPDPPTPAAMPVTSLPAVSPGMPSTLGTTFRSHFDSQQLSHRLAQQQIKGGSNSGNGAGVSTGRVIKRPRSPAGEKCLMCPAVLRTRAILQNHMRVVHKSSSDHRCPECNAEFPWKSTLGNHIRLVHRKERPYNCKLCKKAFRWSSHLQEHVWVTHDKMKPFKCGICGKDFGRKNNMQKHIRKVHDEQSARVAASKAARAESARGSSSFTASF